MKEAHLRRYQVGVAFIAVTVSFALAVLALKHASDAQHEQDRARIAAVAKLTRQIEVTGERTRALRRRQLAALHAQAIRSCHSRHALALVLETLLQRSIKDSNATPIPGASPEQQAAIDTRVAQGLKLARDGLRLAKKADCHSVPALPKTIPDKKS
jgi:hypothetical protein